MTEYLVKVDGRRPARVGQAIAAWLARVNPTCSIEFVAFENFDPELQMRYAGDFYYHFEHIGDALNMQLTFSEYVKDTIMVSRVQMGKQIELQREGWQMVGYQHSDITKAPIGGAALMVNAHEEVIRVMPDGTVRRLVEEEPIQVARDA